MEFQTHSDYVTCTNWLVKILFYSSFVILINLTGIIKMDNYSLALADFDKLQQESRISDLFKVFDYYLLTPLKHTQPFFIGQSDNKIDHIDIDSELKWAKEAIFENNFNAVQEIYESLAVKYNNFHEKILDELSILTFIISLNVEIHGYIFGQICLHYLGLNKLISDEQFREVEYFCISVVNSLGLYDQEIQIRIQIVQRFNNDPQSRNDLAQLYMNGNYILAAKRVLEESLKQWPNNGTSLALYGLILSTKGSFEDAVHYLRLSIETNEKLSNQQKIYNTLGNALFDLNRTDEARKVFQKAAANKIFLNEYQRPSELLTTLKSQPIWTKEEITNIDIFTLFESNWQQIRDEGMDLLHKGYFEISNKDITYGLWKQLQLSTNGKILKKCKIAPFTCSLVKNSFSPDLYSFGGSVKFSAIYPNTHIKPHCGPHNIRIRAHLGLKIPNGTSIRIADRKERSWEEGKFFIFDDSFEHELWHNGSSIRLVFIIDFRHPDYDYELKI